MVKAASITKRDHLSKYIPSHNDREQLHCRDLISGAISLQICDSQDDIVYREQMKYCFSGYKLALSASMYKHLHGRVF